MKRVFAALALLLFTGLSFAQNCDPLTADSVTVTRNADNSFAITITVVITPVDSATIVYFLQNRLKGFKSQAAALEQAVPQKIKQAEKEAAFFEQQTGVNVDSLYSDILQKLVGDWRITVGGLFDNLTIGKNGRFKTKKSGDGQIKVESDDKIAVIFEGKEAIELYRKGDHWVSIDGEKVTLTPKIEGQKKQ